MNVNKRVVLLAAAATVLVTLTACGGSGSSETVEVDGDTVKVGLSVPLSGATATAGTATKCGVQAALDERNRAGGVAGYTLETVVEDNQYDPGIASSIARDFVNSGVFTTVVAGTATMESTAQVAKSRGMAVFGSPDGTAMTPPKWGGEFGYNAQYVREGASAATFIRQTLNEKSASVVYLSPAAKPVSEGFASAFSKAGGTVAVNEAAPADLTDYAPIAQKLASAKAPVVYTALVDTQMAALQKAASAVGYHPTWVAWTITQGPSYTKLAGGLSEGVYFSAWAIPDTETADPAVKKYVDAVRAVPGCADMVGDNATKTGYALGSAIVYGVENAAKDSDKLTGDDFIAALSDVNDHQFGITPHMSYNAQSHAGVQQNSYWRFQGGTLQQVRGFEPLPEA